MRGEIDRTGYLTLRQAAAWIGMGDDRNAADRLRRRLERIEDDRRTRLICRDSKPWTVTRAMLRDNLREHFSRRDEALAKLDAQFRRMADTLRRRKIEIRALGARIRSNTARIEQLEGMWKGRKQRRTTTHGDAALST